jgi:hypothetical protein
VRAGCDRCVGAMIEREGGKSSIRKAGHKDASRLRLRHCAVRGARGNLQPMQQCVLPVMPRLPSSRSPEAHRRGSRARSRTQNCLNLPNPQILE